ncbi:hypothetical protein Aple_103030 [Acrocarpospora pleiomorpha]|uniref:Uncharacterized protein n=1 Tax=Acrocarpospora pleiomorpha TaxID=90975 RepID=A0A5M3Y554_9ACTN|nr:hypothetical protein Aple_103030 [Acrocarpospora pleiomorpha]
MDQDRRVAAHVMAGPEAADVGEKANGHPTTIRDDVPEDAAEAQLVGAAPAGSAPCPDVIGGSPALIAHRVVR